MTDQKLSFELISDVNGTGVTSPLDLRAYIVLPDAEEAEVIVGAVFSQVTGAVFDVTVPASYFVVTGLHTIFVTAAGASSREPITVMVGGIPTGSDVYVPFVARSADGKPMLDVSSVQLSVPGVTRASASGELRAFLDYLSDPLPLYTVKIRSTELSVAGKTTYIVSSSGMQDFVGYLAISEPAVVRLTVRLSPALQSAKIDVLQGSGTFTTLISDADGEATLDIPEGSYVLRVSKLGLVFSTNNHELTVVSGMHDLVVLDAKHMQETLEPVGFCKMRFKLRNADGSPMADTRVSFYPIMSAVGGAGVSKNPLAARTNFNGEGMVALLPGLVVRVNIEGTRLYEEFTVPNLAEANLFDYITFQDKSFEAYVADFPDSIRRTLQD